MFTFRNLYFLWLIIHVAALIFSGWFGNILIYKGASWTEVIGYSGKFWPLQTLNIAHYDITEFLIYYAIVPYYVYKFVSSIYMWGKKC